MSNETYNSLVKALELEAVNLINLQLWKDESASLPLAVRHSFKVFQKERRPQELVAEVQFTLEAFPNPEGKSKAVVEEVVNQDNRLMKIEMTWHLSYSVDDVNALDVDEETLNAFLNRNVPLNIWPFIREIVHSLTSKMGFAPLVLPLLKR